MPPCHHGLSGYRSHSRSVSSFAKLPTVRASVPLRLLSKSVNADAMTSDGDSPLDDVITLREIMASTEELNVRCRERCSALRPRKVV